MNVPFLTTPLLSLFTFYIATGNILRLFKSSAFTDNLLITEFVLYALATVCFFCLILPFYHSLPFYAVICAIGFSAIYGCLLNSFHLPSLLHALRLILMILTGITLGKVLFLRYYLNFQQFLQYFQKAYFYNVFLGFFIYLFFRSSVSLWYLLSQVGIEFRADPHIGRFVSPYFDPNLFAAIGCIPFLISSALSTKKNPWIIVPFIFAILLTWSRSGLMTFAILALYQFISKISLVFRIRISTLSIAVFFLIALVSIAFFCFDDILYFATRILYIKHDGSAIGRLDSFQLGLSIFLQAPFLGIGYNFLSLYLAEVNLFSFVDSSLLATFINFGWIGTLCFLSWLTTWALRTSQRFKRYRSEHPAIVSFFSSFLFYTTVCILFTCNFNNLIYYQFWLIPVLSIFSYLVFYLEEVERTQKQLIHQEAL